MSESTPEIEPNVPVISSRARTILYVGCLIVNVAVIVVLGLASIFGLIEADKAAAAGVVILGGVGLVSSGLAVGYRPTRR